MTGPETPRFIKAAEGLYTNCLQRPMTSPETRYITDREAAGILGYSVQSLRNWRWKRTGPPYRVKNRSIRYEVGELLAWMNETTIRPEAGR